MTEYRISQVEGDGGLGKEPKTPIGRRRTVRFLDGIQVLGTGLDKMMAELYSENGQGPPDILRNMTAPLVRPFIALIVAGEVKSWKTEGCAT